MVVQLRGIRNMLSKLCNELNSNSFKIILENTFLDHGCLFEKPLLLPTKVPPWFTSDFSKLALQLQKPVQPDLKPVQPISRLFLCHLCSDLCDSQKLSEKSCAEIFRKPVQPDLSPAQPILSPVESSAD